MKTKEGGVMDIHKDLIQQLKGRAKFCRHRGEIKTPELLERAAESLELAKAKAQAVPAQLDVNSILHDIDCYFDNGLSNTERTTNNLLQSIYEKLSGDVKAQEQAND